MTDQECSHVACQCVADRLKKAETEREALANVIMEEAKLRYQSLGRISKLTGVENIPTSWMNLVPESLHDIFEDDGIKPLD